MQQDGGAGRVGDLTGGVDVVVVAVRTDHGDHAPATDGVQDRAGLVRGVDHDDLGVVADQPDVVVDVEVLAVEARRLRW